MKEFNSEAIYTSYLCHETTSLLIYSCARLLPGLTFDFSCYFCKPVYSLIDFVEKLQHVEFRLDTFFIFNILIIAIF